MFFAAGGHWAVLQTVAWSRMLIDYSKTSSLATALSDTFDSDHPCPMCKKIAKGKQAEKREQQNTPDTKTAKAPDLYCALRLPSALPPSPEFQVLCGRAASAASQFIDTPPTPPPLRALELA